VAGDPYTVFVHVPQGYQRLGARAPAGAVTVKEGPNPGILMDTFQGQIQPVKWAIDFAKR
jgi:hypothetical protein